MGITVNTPGLNRITINTKNRTGVTVAPTGGAGGAKNLANLADVDASGAEDGEVVVYNEATDGYVVKPLPSLDGGEF